MLHLTLGAALFAGATTSPASVDDHLAYIPDECPLVLRFGDIGAMMTRPAEDRGAWESFLADERVLGIFMEQFSGEDFGADDEELLVSMMTSFHGGAFGLTTEDGSFDDARMYGAFRGGENFADLLREVAAIDDDELTETEIDGHPTFVFAELGEDRSLTFTDIGDLFVVTVTEEETAEDTIRGMIARASSGESDPWWASIDGRVPDATAEFMLDAVAMAEVDADMEEAAAYMESVCMGIRLGQGNDADGCLQVNLVENEIVSELAGHMGTPSEELFHIAPEGAMTVQAINIDVLGMVQSVVALMDEYDPESGAGEEFEAAAEALASALGLDLEEDILGNLSGDMFIVQWPVDGVDVDDPASAAALFPVLGLEISDPEPFLELMESVEPLLEGIGQLSEEDDFTSLDFALPGVTISVLLTDDTLYAGNTDQIDEVRSRRGVKAEGGAFGTEVIEDVAAAFDSGGFALMDMGMAMDFVFMGIEAGSMPDLPEEGLDVFEAFGEHIQGTGFSTFELTAKSLTIKLGTR